VTPRLRAASQAFADEHCLRQLFWLLHGPPSLEALGGALALLRAVSGAAALGGVAAAQGGWLYATELLLPRPAGTWPWQVRRGRQAQRKHPFGSACSASWAA
jgi:DnaJ family protein C protein 13